MDFVNSTPYPSLTFQAADQHRQSCQVIVARATFDIGNDGSLQLSDNQEPIVLNDEFFGEPNKSSVRQESDLIPYKPKCDVIVNGTAHAPGGRSSVEFLAAVRINEPPHNSGRPGSVILDKKVLVTGPRRWEKKLMGGWKLTTPTVPITSLPLRYEHAFGGECRIDVHDPDAGKVDPAFLLTIEQRKHHPDGYQAAPAAHCVYESNPLGTGYMEEWYLRAKSPKEIQAPQIVSPDAPLTTPFATYVPQGFGIIAKTWRQRHRLAGTFDDGWLLNRWPQLPDDFDSAFWNGVHQDMQIPHLSGGEIVTLTNLTPGGTLSFEIPKDFPYMLIMHEGGKKASHLARLDTVLINSDIMKVSLVWRHIIPTPPVIVCAEVQPSRLGNK